MSLMSGNQTHQSLSHGCRIFTEIIASIPRSDTSDKQVSCTVDDLILLSPVSTLWESLWLKSYANFDVEWAAPDSEWKTLVAWFWKQSNILVRFKYRRPEIKHA